MEVGKAKVIDCKPRHNGDRTYQAEMFMAHDGSMGGFSRTMAIRGPARNERDIAEDDADALQKAVPDGLKAVKALAAKLKNSRIKAASS